MVCTFEAVLERMDKQLETLKANISELQVEMNSMKKEASELTKVMAKVRGDYEKKNTVDKSSC